MGVLGDDVLVAFCLLNNQKKNNNRRMESMNMQPSVYMKQDKVSIIIPTYGGSESLLKSVDSVLLQDYSEFEIMIQIQMPERKQSY